MVAITRKGFIKNVQRVSSQDVSCEGVEPFKLEDCKRVGRRKAYLVTPEQWNYLKSVGWKIKDIHYAPICRVVERDDDFELREIDYIPKDIILEKCRRFGMREYCDLVTVRIDWGDRLRSSGWELADTFAEDETS